MFDVVGWEGERSSSTFELPAELTFLNRSTPTQVVIDRIHTQLSPASYL